MGDTADYLDSLSDEELAEIGEEDRIQESGIITGTEKEVSFEEVLAHYGEISHEQLTMPGKWHDQLCEDLQREILLGEHPPGIRSDAERLLRRLCM